MSLSPRLTLAAVVSLVGAGVAIIAQYALTPVTGDLTARELVTKATEHHTAMGWALALDVPIAVLAPTAFLFLGTLAGAGTKKLAAIATVLCFGGLLLSLGPIIGLDHLTFLASQDHDKVAAAHVLDTWQKTTWFTVTLFIYLASQVIGYILMGIALIKAKAVPAWAGVALAISPVVQIVGYDSSKAIALAAYVLLFLAFAAAAVTVVNSSKSRIGAGV